MKQAPLLYAALALGAYWLYSKRATAAGAPGNPSAGSAGAVGGAATRTATGVPIQGAPVPNAATQLAAAGVNALGQLLQSLTGGAGSNKSANTPGMGLGSAGGGGSVNNARPKSSAASPIGDQQAYQRLDLTSPFLVPQNDTFANSTSDPFATGDFSGGGFVYDSSTGSLSDFSGNDLSGGGFNDASVFTDYSAGNYDTGSSGSDLGAVDYSGG